MLINISRTNAPLEEDNHLLQHIRTVAHGLDENLLLLHLSQTTTSGAKRAGGFPVHESRRAIEDAEEIGDEVIQTRAAAGAHSGVCTEPRFRNGHRKKPTTSSEQIMT